MDKTLFVTYYLHSGFSCALGKTLLIFDYWLGEHGELAERKRIQPEFLRRFDDIYVFVSHGHPDHYDPVINSWQGVFPVTYIVSYDMPVGTRGKRMKPGDTLRFGDRMTVQAFDSTDLGVSFLVTLEDIRIFHAGDLNFWHWREESTVQEIEEADEAFRKACAPIPTGVIDIAFFPVDPRQGRLYDAGANYFIMTVKPRLLVPMHFWGRAENMAEFARRSRNRDTEIVAMVRPAEQLQIQIDEDGFMTIYVDQDTGPALPETDDVFGETDLPVDLEGLTGGEK